MRTVGTALIAILLLATVYVLSYAPVYRRHAPYKQDLPTQPVTMIPSNFSKLGLSLPIYGPVEWLIDETPPRPLLLGWASVFGVRDEMDLDSFWRRDIRASLVTTKKARLFDGRTLGTKPSVGFNLVMKGFAVRVDYVSLAVFYGIVASAFGWYVIVVDLIRQRRSARLKGEHLPPPQLTLRWALVGMALLALTAAAVRACSTVYWTDGIIGQFVCAFLLTALLLTLGPLGVIVFLVGRPRSRLLYTGLVVLLLGPSVASQEAVMLRYADLKVEIPRICRYLEKTKSETGSYPRDLSRYKFQNPELRAYVTYFPYDESSDFYVIDFHPTHSQTVNHTICAGDTTWKYYDD